MRRAIWMLGLVAAVGVVGVVGVVGSCAHKQAAAPVTPTINTPAMAADQPVELKGLHNVVSYAPGFMSGSAPEGDDGFETLRQMGVHTVISVDGAEPDIAAARAHGLRYIHLPIGYNGMGHPRTLEIAKAVEVAKAQGPVYIHCHHGKHRSAGAAGAAAVTLGWMTRDEATAKLKVSGTSPSYKGLYQCVAVAYPASGAELAAVGDDFPEVSRPSGYVESMLEIDEVMDHLKAIDNAGWKPPADHPDLVPVAEAGRMADLFRILADGHMLRARPAEVRTHLREASRIGQEIEDGLGATPQMPNAELSKRLKALAASCTDCHAKFRD